MTPIFGEGVVFDASPEERRKALHNQALRDKFMRGHAATIAVEVERMLAQSPAGGDIDLLDWFAELTIYTSSACLIGRHFREQLDGRFASLYHDLEQGTDALAYVDPYADIPSFRTRDAARVGLVQLVEAIMATRAAAPERDDRDLLDVLMSIKAEDGTDRFSADIITGMFISMMFAGHHTTSGTAAWTLIELLQRAERHHRMVERHAEERGCLDVAIGLVAQHLERPGTESGTGHLSHSAEQGLDRLTDTRARQALWRPPEVHLVAVLVSERRQPIGDRGNLVVLERIADDERSGFLRCGG